MVGGELLGGKASLTAPSGHAGRARLFARIGRHPPPSDEGLERPPRPTRQLGKASISPESQLTFVIVRTSLSRKMSMDTATRRNARTKPITNDREPSNPNEG